MLTDPFYNIKEYNTYSPQMMSITTGRDCIPAAFQSQVNELSGELLEIFQYSYDLQEMKCGLTIFGELVKCAIRRHDFMAINLLLNDDAGFKLAGIFSGIIPSMIVHEGTIQVLQEYLDFFLPQSRQNLYCLTFPKEIKMESNLGLIINLDRVSMLLRSCKFDSNDIAFKNNIMITAQSLIYKRQKYTRILEIKGDNQNEAVKYFLTLGNWLGYPLSVIQDYVKFKQEKLNGTPYIEVNYGPYRFSSTVSFQTVELLSNLKNICQSIEYFKQFEQLQRLNLFYNSP